MIYILYKFSISPSNLIHQILVLGVQSNIFMTAIWIRILCQGCKSPKKVLG